MENKLTIFNYEQNEVKTILDDKFEIWFLAKDVCNILELTEVSKFMERLDDDEKLIRKIFASGQIRDMWFINESGLYNLVLSSNKKEAKKFSKWVRAEVLPSIRKTGSYNYQPLNQLLPAEIKARNSIALKILIENTASIYKLDEKNILMYAQDQYYQEGLQVPNIPLLQIKDESEIHYFKTEIYEKFNCQKDNPELKKQINAILTEYETSSEYAGKFLYKRNGHTGNTIKYNINMIKLIEKQLNIKQRI
jgi:prophage antirepressor-like protein